MTTCHRTEAGSTSLATAIAGFLWTCRGAGVPTPSATGSIRITGGCGSARTRGAGSPTTMDAGPTTAITAGYGCRTTMRYGRPRGSPGATATTTLDGLRCRPTRDGEADRVSPSTFRSSIAESPDPAGASLRSACLGQRESVRAFYLPAGT